MANLERFARDSSEDDSDTEGTGAWYRAKAAAEAKKRSDVLSRSQRAYAERRRAEAKEVRGF